MTSFHAAVVHPDQTATYCGTVDQAHLDSVRAIAALDDVPRHALEHPSRPGSVFVLREDGNLDFYEPVDAAPFTISPPDPNPRILDGDPAEAGLLPRGATKGTVWIPGAIRLGDGVIGGAMAPPATRRGPCTTPPSPRPAAGIWSRSART